MAGQAGQTDIVQKTLTEMRDHMPTISMLFGIINKNNENN
jgi:hypothetical protein